MPDDGAVAGLSRLMSLPHRALRLPLRVVQRFVEEDARYQDLILPYWQGMLKVQHRLGGVGSRAE